MGVRNSLEALYGALQRLAESFEEHQPKLVDVAFVVCTTLLLGSYPAAAQPDGSGNLDQLVTFLNDIAGLLQRVGIALAVLGLSAAGIAYIIHKKRSAKSIAQSVIIGTVILLLSGAAVDYLAQGLA